MSLLTRFKGIETSLIFLFCSAFFSLLTRFKGIETHGRNALHIYQPWLLTRFKGIETLVEPSLLRPLYRY